MKKTHWLIAAGATLVVAGLITVDAGDRSLTAPGHFLADQAFGSNGSGVKCKTVAGRMEETLIHPIGAPGDMLGRVMGEVRGTLSGSETAIVTNILPGPDGTLLIDTVNVFVTGIGDTLTTLGSAVFTPISETDVKDELTLTIQPDKSTGKYAGATGTIEVEGVGFNLFPGPAPGETTFMFRYTGEICYPHDDDGDGDDDDDDDL